MSVAPTPSSCCSQELHSHLQKTVSTLTKDNARQQRKIRDLEREVETLKTDNSNLKSQLQSTHTVSLGSDSGGSSYQAQQTSGPMASLASLTATLTGQQPPSAVVTPAEEAASLRAELSTIEQHIQSLRAFSSSATSNATKRPREEDDGTRQYKEAADGRGAKPISSAVSSARIAVARCYVVSTEQCFTERSTCADAPTFTAASGKVAFAPTGSTATTSTSTTCPGSTAAVGVSAQCTEQSRSKQQHNVMSAVPSLAKRFAQQTDKYGPNIHVYHLPYTPSFF